MGTFRAYFSVDFYDSGVWYGEVEIADSDHIRISDGTLEQNYYGRFVFGGGYLLDGVVTSFNQYVGTVKYYEASGVSLDAPYFSNLLDYGDSDEINNYVFRSSDKIYGSSQADSIGGFNGNDTIYAGDGNNFVDGGLGNDRVYGGSHSDRIFGYSGNDHIDGANGNDRLSGEGGTDRLYGGGHNDLIFAGSENDTSYGDDGNDSLAGDSGSDRLFGGNGSDQLFGGSENDQVSAGDGNDRLYGGTGNDQLKGESGKDRVIGDDGNDHIYGGNDADSLAGGVGTDRLWGGEGNDRLEAGPGSDTLFGGNGNDTSIGREGETAVFGGNGADRFIVFGGADGRFYGGAGDDYASLGAGTDYLSGSTGADTLFGGAGNDKLSGGSGDDSVIGGAGNDQIYDAGGADRLDGDLGDDTLRGGADNDRLFGGAGNDRLYGNDDNDVLSGLSGDDRLYGGNGNDVLYGGEGDDAAVYIGDISEYSITRDGGLTTIRSDGAEGVDRLVGVEWLVFADGSVPNANRDPTAPADSSRALNQVTEGAAAGTASGIVASSVDPDGDAVRYSLTDSAGGRFAVNAVTGAVSVRNGALLDHERFVEHEITVVATDVIGATSSATFTVGVLNVNEQPGELVDANPGANTVGELASAGAGVGLTVRSTDPDGDRLLYELRDDADGRFAINSRTGVISVADAGLLDFETASSHLVKIRAVDPGGLSVEEVFTINISDVDEPPFNLRDVDLTDNAVFEGAAAGSTVGLTAIALDPDGAGLTYSLVDDADGRFVMDPGTGLVTVADEAVFDFDVTPSLGLVIRAADPGGQSVDRLFEVAVRQVMEESLFEVGG